MFYLRMPRWRSISHASEWAKNVHHHSLARAYVQRLRTHTLTHNARARANSYLHAMKAGRLGMPCFVGPSRFAFGDRPRCAAASRLISTIS